MSGHPILSVITRLLLPFILLFALYVQFHGDFGPGGGFQAGVIFAAGFILHIIVFGLEKTERALPMKALRLAMSAGVLLYAGVGLWPLAANMAYLDYDALGDQHYGILLIELGVGVTVASVMLIIFYSFTRNAQKRLSLDENDESS